MKWRRVFRRIKRKISKSFDTHPQIDYLLKDCLDDVRNVKKQTESNKESTNDAQDRLKLLELKVKILETLLARTVPNYAEEILKVYWTLGDKKD
jgi:hypothetical protein